MAWIKLPAVSVANGDIVVSVTGGVDLSSVLSGWALIINGNYVEIKSGTSADGNGNSTLTLAEAWDGSTISNQPAKIMPTSAPALEIAQLMTDTNEFAIAVHQKLEEYAMQDKDITLEAPSGETATFASLPKTERVMQAFRDAAGTAYAYDVTESATDKTVDRLMKFKDFGVGANPKRYEAVDFQNFIDINFQGFAWVRELVTGSPFTSRSAHVLCLVTPTHKNFLAFEENPGSNVSRVKVLSTTGAGDTGWQEMLHTLNTGIKPSTPERTLINTETDNGLNQLQVGGSIYASNYLSSGGRRVNWLAASETTTDLTFYHNAVLGSQQFATLQITVMTWADSDSGRTSVFLVTINGDSTGITVTKIHSAGNASDNITITRPSSDRLTVSGGSVVKRVFLTHLT